MFGEPERVFIDIVWRPAVIGLSSGLLIAALFSLGDPTQRYTSKLQKNVLPALGFSVPVTLLAYLAGYLAGISRSPVIGNIVPAVLALLGGLNLYIFGADAKNRGIIACNIVLFGLVLLYALQVGAIEREVGREARLIALSEQERKIRFFRKNRDLPPDLPGWLVATEPK
jgi:hypothetical protein